ncbi:hypothetical protein [Novosphingobium album (ex Hu et al. 2023)]|uniref:Uncharacterized protein n=1 Tax=Novosphingobium album (ex Hu et al. 2023) TaxID=2930093 RepID=A0ABT0B3K3_9SPHN|nr:hypothetical protein [Novosphingobium album (ex Hu et al. 2023)]MCJ2179627.1 hypothetical protein [Novosphingobium album (ex Hu et al. 2023)]
MTIEMRGRGLQWALALAVSLAAVALGAFAWIDGGKQPVHDIVMPVAVPELPQ